MANSILCPFHNDTRPSMVVYGEWCHCFVCGAHVPSKEINLPRSMINTPKPEPTNIVKRMEYIQALPKKRIRGFDLHEDRNGYYITWPDKSFYKRRNYFGKSRYTAPSGVKPPLFVYPGDSTSLILVEGELNAMSLYYSLEGGHKVASVGPASDFMRHIRYLLQFNSITIIADKDAPGIVFGCALKDRLLSSRIRVKLILCTKDLNQILQEEGEEGVRSWFEKESA